MYVHLDPRLLERRPWIGVAIGAAGIVLFGMMFAAFHREIQRLAGQTAPEDVTPATLELSDARPRRWVRLVGGRWDCARSLAQRRRVPERWLFGEVEAVFVPVRDDAGRSLLVLRFDRAVDCAPLAGEPIAGMLARPGDSVWGGAVPKAQLGFAPTFVLNVDDDPAELRWMRWGALGFLAAMTGFAGFYLKKWQAQLERRSSLVA